MNAGLLPTGPRRGEAESVLPGLTAMSMTEFPNLEPEARDQATFKVFASLRPDTVSARSTGETEPD